MKEKIISWNKVPRGTKVQVKNLMDEEWKEAYFEETYDGCFYFYKAKINDNIDLYKYLTYGQLLSILLNIFHNNLYFELLWN